MVRVSWLVLAASLFPFLGCGGSDTARRVRAEDGGPDTGAGGAAMQSGGSGGRTGGAAGAATTGGSAGDPVTGGAPSVEAGPPSEASVEGGAPEASAPEAAPIPDAAAETGPEAAVDGGELVCSADGGVVDGGDGGAGEWRDFAAGVCRSCPASEVTCQDLLASPGPSYDPTTRLLTMHLAPGIAEIVSAELSVNYMHSLADGGVSEGAATAFAEVRRNTLTIDLSSQVPEGTTNIDGGRFTVTDACGRISRTGSDPAATRVVLTPLDAGGVATTCVATD